jgi:uncharacterized membrane protein
MNEADTGECISSVIRFERGADAALNLDPARLGWLDLASTPLAFLGSAFTPWILTVMALGKLVADQLPTTPSRLPASPAP